MMLTTQQQQLLDFVKHYHADQKRKFTFEPYWHHVYSVAERVYPYAPEGVEAALCHDLLEDTPCTASDLRQELLRLGYSADQADTIVETVIGLTNAYTHESHPHLNRNKRKALESERMENTSPLVHSIKYADIIDNTGSIAEKDPGFARVYLPEKIRLLDRLRKGNIHLLMECFVTLDRGLRLLEEVK